MESSNEYTQYGFLFIDKSIVNPEEYIFMLHWINEATRVWNNIDTENNPPVYHFITSIKNGVCFETFCRDDVKGDRKILQHTEPVCSLSNEIMVLSNVIMQKFIYSGIANFVLLTPTHMN